MENNFQKPLYKDYKKQKAHLSFLKDPVLSMERSYLLADRPLAILGEVLILAAILIVSFYVPGYFASVLYGISGLLIICSFYLANIFYARFVYMHGRFHVEWEHPLEHPDENASDNCERYGDFLKTEENSMAAKKSRFTFLALFAGVAAAVFLYCFLGYGLAYARAYGWHRGEIEDAARIAQKYESLFVYTWNNDVSVEGIAADGDGINTEDENVLKQIFRSLRGDYADSMGSGEAYGEKPGKRFTISFHGGFHYSYLVRYEDNVDISQVMKDYPDEAITQLDEHWWYVR